MGGEFYFAQRNRWQMAFFKHDLRERKRNHVYIAVIMWLNIE